MVGVTPVGADRSLLIHPVSRQGSVLYGIELLPNLLGANLHGLQEGRKCRVVVLDIRSQLGLLVVLRLRVNAQGCVQGILHDVLLDVLPVAPQFLQDAAIQKGIDVFLNVAQVLLNVLFAVQDLANQLVILDAPARRPEDRKVHHPGTAPDAAETSRVPERNVVVIVLNDLPIVCSAVRSRHVPVVNDRYGTVEVQHERVGGEVLKPLVDIDESSDVVNVRVEDRAVQEGRHALLQ
mmetsp:Transcript_48544/g.90075  ORF Transcript_48544/g.90075 Transcript_48544/m.90075 type:complete len:236 (-) Transcript_48544:584-1291(-)